MQRDNPGAAAESADSGAFAFGQPLPPAFLCHRCDEADLPFALCSELEEAPGRPDRTGARGRGDRVGDADAPQGL